MFSTPHVPVILSGVAQRERSVTLRPLATTIVASCVFGAAKTRFLLISGFKVRALVRPPSKEKCLGQKPPSRFLVPIGGIYFALTGRSIASRLMRKSLALSPSVREVET